jgi:hypothetical protein
MVRPTCHFRQSRSSVLNSLRADFPLGAPLCYTQQKAPLVGGAEEKTWKPLPGGGGRVGLLQSLTQCQVWPDEGGDVGGSGDQTWSNNLFPQLLFPLRGDFDPAHVALVEMKRAPAEASDLMPTDRWIGKRALLDRLHRTEKSFGAFMLSG